jgi:type IV secretory pathway VirJ component
MRLSRGKITAAVLSALLLGVLSGMVAWLTVAHYMRLAPFAERGDAHDSAAADLPLVIVPANLSRENSELMAILYTGDGGWTPINQRLTAELARHGVPTVGVISPRYFWSRRTPAGAARDLGRLIDLYSTKWGRPRVILIGYSRGAGVLPALVNRLDAPSRDRIDTLALLGLEPRIAFAVGLRDYAFGLFDTDEFDVLPELKKLKIPRAVCFYGERETKSLSRQLNLPGVQKIALPGGHHFGGAYERIAQMILKSSGHAEVAPHRALSSTPAGAGRGYS